MARYEDWEKRLLESYQLESGNIWCSPEAIRELRSGRSPVLVGFMMAALLPASEKYDKLFNRIVDLSCDSIHYRANISEGYWDPLGTELSRFLHADQHLCICHRDETYLYFN
jgi:hypothetical protein